MTGNDTGNGSSDSIGHSTSGGARRVISVSAAHLAKLEGKPSAAAYLRLLAITLHQPEAKLPADAAPLTVALAMIELAADGLRQIGRIRAADELVEIAVEVCPASQRDALAARLGIIVGETA